MLKEDLSIDTTFNPHQFSSDSTFNTVYQSYYCKSLSIKKSMEGFRQVAEDTPIQFDHRPIALHTEFLVTLAVIQHTLNIVQIHSKKDQSPLHNKPINVAYWSSFCIDRVRQVNFGKKLEEPLLNFKTISSPYPRLYRGNSVQNCVKKRLASGDINILTPMKFLK